MGLSVKEISVPGKWVLCGEHAVLRGGPALALPRHDLGLKLVFENDEPLDGLHVHPFPAQDLIRSLTLQLIDLLKSRGHFVGLPSGILKIESTIPLGGGLGSSAALCVALTQWLANPFCLKTQEIIAIATELENHFHGKSSGMDVAVIAVGEPILFRRAEKESLLPKIEKLNVARLPDFQFHDTGLRAKTSDCISTVESLWISRSKLAIDCDDRMKSATLSSAQALQEFHETGSSQSLDRLAQAMNLAQTCFYDWKLIPERIRMQEMKLKSEGARAVKLTGAGNGGSLVSLWHRS